MRSLNSPLARLVALLGLLLALGGTASGHAVLVEANPADGAVVARAPERILLRFSEPVALIAARILDAKGKDITPAGAVSVQDSELDIAFPATAPDGSYIATYRIVSLDGHPVGGSLVFSVGAPSSDMSRPDMQQADDDGGWRWAMLAARTLLHIGALGGAGGVLYLLLVAPNGAASRSTQRIVTNLAILGAFAAFLALGFQGGLLVDGPAISLASATTWRTGLASSFGRTAIATLLGLALIVAGLSRDGWTRPLALPGAIVVLAALSGHVVTAGPRPLTVPILVAHISAIAFWAGSLLPLRDTIGRLGPDTAPVVRRFSRLALAAVPILIVAGLGIAILQVRSISGLWDTTYGRILLAKLGLVAALLAIAAVNKLRLTTRLARGDTNAAKALRHSIGIEAVLIVTVLVATAALSTTPPPRVLQGEVAVRDMHSAHEDHARELTRSVQSGGYVAVISLASAKSGPNRAQISLADAAGRSVEALEVTLVAANPDAGVEPIRRDAEEDAPGLWQADGLLLAPAGAWTIRVEALVNDFEKPTFEATIDLR